MGDGDDGGPAHLYVYAERKYHAVSTGRIVLATHEEGTYLAGQQFRYDETRDVWDDEYEIDFILQEFDTMYSPVFRNDPETLFKN